jgi:hypothetical protein
MDRRDPCGPPLPGTEHRANDALSDAAAPRPSQTASSAMPCRREPRRCDLHIARTINRLSGPYQPARAFTQVSLGITNACQWPAGALPPLIRAPDGLLVRAFCPIWPCGPHALHRIRDAVLNYHSVRPIGCGPRRVGRPFRRQPLMPLCPIWSCGVSGVTITQTVVVYILGYNRPSYARQTVHNLRVSTSAGRSGAGRKCMPNAIPATSITVTRATFTRPSEF